MKVKRWQIWKKVIYGKKNASKFWSPRIKGEGDKNLAKDSPMKDWRKIIVLKPTGEPETSFSMGFSDIFGNTKVSSAKRKVKEGPFGMRMGPDDCEFFVVSNDDAVGLKFVEYADIGDETEPELQLY